MDYILAHSGKQFDPDLVKALETALPKIIEIRTQLLDPDPATSNQ